MPNKKLEIPEYLKQQFFADSIGAKKSNFSNIKAGDKPLSPERAAKIAGACRAVIDDLEEYIEYLYSFIPFDASQKSDKYDEIEKKYSEKIFRSLSSSYRKKA